MQNYLTLIYLIAIFAIFYFFIIRPQQMRAKQHADLVSTLSTGDRVVTAGGIYGTVTRVEEDSVMVEVAPDVELRMAKDAIVTKV